MISKKILSIDLTSDERGTEYVIPQLLLLCEKYHSNNMWILDKIDIGVEDTQEAATILLYSDLKKPISSTVLLALITKSTRVIDGNYYTTSIQIIDGQLYSYNDNPDNCWIEMSISDGSFIDIYTEEILLMEELRSEYNTKDFHIDVD